MPGLYTGRHFPQAFVMHGADGLAWQVGMALLEGAGRPPPAAGRSGLQEVGDGDRLVAMNAEAADVEAAAEGVAALAALGAEVALVAVRALVDDLVPERLTRRWLRDVLAEPVGELAVGVGAVGGAGAGRLGAADGTASSRCERWRRHS